MGVSGRAMLDALVEGTKDAEAVAELARGSLRKKIPLLKAALEGHFTAHHAVWPVGREYVRAIGAAPRNANRKRRARGADG